MAAKGYVSAADIAQYMGWDPNDASVIADVNLHLEVAEMLVEQYCKTRFDRETGKQRLYSGDGTDMLTTGYFMETLTLVEILDPLNAGVTNETLDPVDTVMCPDEPTCGRYRWIERRDGLNFPEGKQNIRVTADYGWGFDSSQPPVWQGPAPIKLAIAMTVKRLFDQRMINEFVVMESGGGRLIQMRNPFDFDRCIPMTASGYLREYRNGKGFK